MRPPASSSGRRTMKRRTRYQFGNLELSKRRNGPDLWQYRWRDRSGDKVIRRSVMLGTVEEYPTEALALRAAEHWRISVNDEAQRREPVTFGGVLDRYEREQMPERISTRTHY